MMPDTGHVRRAMEAVERYLREDRDDLPADHQAVVGDGNYRATGAEFLDQMVRLGRLHPDAFVVDIGCGLGRMALPLRYYLNEHGRYLGIDVSASNIAWCVKHVTDGDPRFTFAHFDAYHPLYNPGGRIALETADFDVMPRDVDFIIMISVFTHLSESMARRYLRECHRMLRAGGRLFATFFLVDDRNRDDVGANPRYAFEIQPGGGIHYLPGDALLSAVATEESWLLAEATEAVGFKILERCVGRWSQPALAADAPFQEIVVFQK